MSLEQVARISVEAAVLAVFVALLCALVPRLRAGHRAILWWLVAAKLLVGLVPLPAVRVVALPAPKTIEAAAAATTAALPRVPAEAPAPSIARAAAPRRTMAWAWLAGAALLSLAAVPDGIRVRRWLRAGRPLEDDASRLAIARAARAAGLRRVPRVLAVPDLDTPLATGLLRPTVLLPADDLERLGAEDLEMALAHEMAHIARGDLWLGLVPALARRIFFFHPAAWIAEREYAIAREAACDEAVLGREDADPFAYGRLLLRLTTRRELRTAIPMSPHSMLRRRLEMIDSTLRRVPLGRAGWALVALAALAMVPIRLVAKEAGDRACLEIGSSKDTAYIITNGDSHTMCGPIEDIRLAEAQRRKGEDVIWFRADGETWVVRDAGVVAEARALFAAVDGIGQKQGAIGQKQAKFGMEQALLGLEQGQIGVQQGIEARLRAAIEMRRKVEEDLERAERDRVEAARDDAEAESARKADLERQLAQREAERSQARSGNDIDARMRELAARMEVLGREQAELGEQQRALGERMIREVAEAQRALSELLERAMRDGTALRAD
ncbi:MAG TPA: M56 family metallopeptidase [Candidatus Polarisedimenticolaceae bacterium]|nr:M56 family metallopeptidase [Candidatus Polarisedimenticolaceae bacterium]